MKTTPERANEYMERIQRVYDEHMDMLEKMVEEETADPDEVVRDMVLAEYNYERMAALYELDSAAFVETVEKAMTMEDIDVWLDILMREPAE